jgi:hypothetical protein
MADNISPYLLWPCVIVLVLLIVASVSSCELIYYGIGDAYNILQYIILVLLIVLTVMLSILYKKVRQNKR